MAQYITSIMIPVFNEAVIIKQTLWVLQENSAVEINVVKKYQ